MKAVQLGYMAFLGLLLCSISSYGQKKTLRFKPVMFPIESVEIKKDSVFATINFPFNIGIENRMNATAYQKYRAKTENSNVINFDFVGSGRIISTGNKIVAFIKLNDPGISLAPEDLIEIELPIPEITDRGVLSDLAFYNILLSDNYKVPFFTIQSVWAKDSKLYQDSLYNEMSLSLREVHDMIKDEPQGKDLDSTFTEGNYTGTSALKMLGNPKKEDLESFLYFVYSFPGKYIGYNYKFSETYATWLINRAPKSHKEVINKLMPIYKNKTLFLKSLEKYRYDVLKEGHSQSIVDEVSKLHKENKKEEAINLNEFAKALAYEVNDNDGKTWYWLMKAEMLHDDGKYLEALPFCDSSLVYSKRSGSKEFELNALLKKLFCQVYSKQYQQAVTTAEVSIKMLESYKDDLPKTVYLKNLVKIYEYEGNAYYENGEYAKALILYNKIVDGNIVLNTYTSLNKNGLYYKFIGQVNNEQGLVDEALINFYKAAKIHEANTDTLALANIQSEIAYSYNKKGDYKKSIEYTELARKNSSAVNDMAKIGYTYSVDGSSYWNQGDYAAAEKSHKKSIEYRAKTGREDLQADSWNKLGALYLESGSKKLALSAYDSAIAKYKNVKDVNSVADMYNKQGKLFANDENYAIAITYYEKANGVSTKSTADASYNLAQAWTEIDSVKARKYFEQCIKSCQETDDVALEFDATNSLAYLAYTSGNPTMGEILYNRAVILSNKLQYASTKANCYNLKAYGFRTQTKLDSAAFYYQMALNINDTLSPHSAIYGYDNLASIHTSKGDFNSALLAFTKAIDIAKKTNNQIAYGSVLGASSFVYGLVGEFEQGLKNSDTALSIFNKTGNTVRLANTYISRGTLLENQGQYKEAIRSFMIADSIYKEQKLNEYRSTAFTDMGVVYHKQGDHDNSYKYHKMALDLLKKDVVDETYLLTAGNVAEALVYQKKYPEGEKELLRLIPLAKAKEINRVVSGLELAMGKLYYETNQPTKSQQYYKEAYEFSLKSNEKEKIVDALTHLGLIALQQKDIKQAEEHFKAAATVTENFQIAYGWESYYQLGLIYYNQKKYEESIVNFKKAALQLDKNTQNLYGGEAAAKIYNNDPRKADLYEKLTFAYYNTGNIAEAWNYANRSNIAGIKELSGSLSTSSNDVEKNDALKKLLALQQQKKQLEETASKQVGEAKIATLKKIEIQEANYNNFLQDVVEKFPDLSTYFSKSNADEFNNYKAKLPKDVAVLLYLQNNNTLMIFSLTNEKLAVDTMTIDVNQKIEDIIATIKNTGQATGTGSLSLRSDPLDEEEPKTAGDFTKQSAELYDILIGSVYDNIKDKKKLCIIPSGIFSNLPFQCLGKKLNEKKFEFLIEEFNVFYSNKMSIFNNPTTIINNAVNIKSFAAFGVPDPTLTFNIKEVKEIGKILNVSDGIYADKTATESAAKLSLKNKKYIHFATHGVLNYSSDYSQSYLKLLPDSDTTTGNNGKLTMREIQGLGIKDCDMVILSACQTAVSKQLVKGWNISPANSFLVSNVKTVVASLWKVADEPTGLLMEYFYANLANDASITKLDALRKAQIKLSQNPKFAHPNYWGAFVLYGGWE